VSVKSKQPHYWALASKNNRKRQTSGSHEVPLLIESIPFQAIDYISQISASQVRLKRSLPALLRQLCAAGLARLSDCANRHASGLLQLGRDLVEAVTVFEVRSEGQLPITGDKSPVLFWRDELD